jgi:uncharacterized protein with FMN-binding domain
MKRALLIAGGTVGGLGAVLAITPPQLTSSSSSLSLGGGTTLPGTSNAATATPATATPAAATTSVPATKATPAATKASKPIATKSATPSKSAAATTSPAATKSATPAPSATKTTAAPATSNVSGSFTGDPINVGYGIVQVKITVSNGKITDAQAVQAPSGRNDRFTQMAVPQLRQKTLAAQSSQITGVSGASYTSYGWYKSLVSALSKAGLPA